MKCKHTHFPVGVGAVWFNSPASSPHFSSHVDILMHVVLSCTGFGSFPRVVSIFSVLCFRLKSIRHQCFSSSDEIPAEPEGETASCSITPTLVWIHPLERVSCFNLLMDCSPALSTDGEATGWCQWLVIRIISSLAFVSADDISRQRNNLSRIWFQQPPQPWQWWWPVSTEEGRRRAANRWGWDAAAVSLFYRHKYTMKHLFCIDKCLLVVNAFNLYTFPLKDISGCY